MTAPGNDLIVSLIGLLTAMAAAYACGRLHQWYRQTTERDHAFQTGYDRASHSLFHFAARGAARSKPAPAHAAGKGARATATVTSIMEAPSVVSTGRHAALPHELETKTRDLNSARAASA